MSYNDVYCSKLSDTTLSFIRQKVVMRKQKGKYKQVEKTMVKGEERKPNRVRFELGGK